MPISVFFTEDGKPLPKRRLAQLVKQLRTSKKDGTLERQGRVVATAGGAAVERQQHSSSSSSGLMSVGDNSGAQRFDASRSLTAAAIGAAKKITDVLNNWAQMFRYTQDAFRRFAWGGVPAITVESTEQRFRPYKAEIVVGVAGHSKVVCSTDDIKEGCTMDEFAGFVLAPRPAPGVPPRSISDVIFATRMHNIGLCSKEELAAVRSGFEGESLTAEDATAIGLDRVAWDEFFDDAVKASLKKDDSHKLKTDREKICEGVWITDDKVLSAFLAHVGKGSYTWATSSKILGDAGWTFKEKAGISHYAEIDSMPPRRKDGEKMRYLDKRELAVELVDMIKKCILEGQNEKRYRLQRVLSRFYAWGTVENPSHSTTNVGSTVGDILSLPQRIVNDMHTQVPQLAEVGGLEGILRRYIHMGVGRWTGPHLISLFLDTVSNSDNARHWISAHELGLMEQSTNAWPDVWSAHNQLVRRVRTSFDSDPSCKRPDLGQRTTNLGYKQCIANRFEWPLDEAKEREVRQLPRQQPLAYDHSTGTFTSAKGTELYLDGIKRVTQGAASITNDMLESSANLILERACWVANGSVTGFAGRVAAAGRLPKSGKDLQLSELMDVAEARWLRECLRQLEADDDSKEAGATPKYKIQDWSQFQSAAKTEVVRLAKRGALESLSSKAIWAILKEGRPALRMHSVTKYEMAKVRLLLSASLSHYLMQGLLASQVLNSYDKDERYSSAHDAAEEWRQLGWRTRMTEMSKDMLHILRCFDYSDWNSQHSQLALVLMHYAWSEGVTGDLKNGSSKFLDFAELVAWCGAAVCNGTIKWQDGAISCVISTLGSGTRWTTECNTFGSAGADSPIDHNFRCLLTYLNEHNVVKIPDLNRDHRVVSTKRGDDLVDLLRDVMGCPWVTSCILDRVTTATGYVGKASKVLVGKQWSEWLRILQDEQYAFLGSCTRTTCSLVTSSPQNPEFRDVALGPLALVELANLCFRRGSVPAYPALVERVCARYWSRIIYRSDHLVLGSGLAERVAVEARKWHFETDDGEIPPYVGAIPTEWCYASLAKRGGGNDSLTSLGWFTCRTHGVCCFLAEDAPNSGWSNIKCECEYCHVAPFLPDAPSRPERTAMRVGTVQSLPGHMSTEYLNAMLSRYPIVGALSSKAREELLLAIKRDSYSATPPPSEKHYLRNSDDARDLVWSWTLRLWVEVCDMLVAVHDGGTCAYDEHTAKAWAAKARKVFQKLETVPKLPQSLAVPQSRIDSTKALTSALFAVVPGARFLMTGFEDGCPVCRMRREMEQRSRVFSQALSVQRMAEARIVKTDLAEVFYTSSVLEQNYNGRTARSQSFGLASASKLRRQDAFLALVEACSKHIETSAAEQRSGAALAKVLSLMPNRLLNHSVTGIFSKVANRLTSEAARGWFTGAMSVSLPKGAALAEIHKSIVVNHSVHATERFIMSYPNDSLLGTKDIEALVVVFAMDAQSILDGFDRVCKTRGL